MSSLKETSPDRIFFNPAVCRQCRSCELVCSLTHEQACSPRLARLHLIMNVLMENPEMDICRQCGNPKCFEACPVNGAMSIHPKTKAVIIDSATCTACGKCVELCPFNSKRNILFLHPDKNAAVKCDLCMGNPQCVRICPNNALTYHEWAEGGVSSA